MKVCNEHRLPAFGKAHGHGHQRKAEVREADCFEGKAAGNVANMADYSDEASPASQHQEQGFIILYHQPDSAITPHYTKIEDSTLVSIVVTKYLKGALLQIVKHYSHIQRICFIISVKFYYTN